MQLQQRLTQAEQDRADALQDARQAKARLQKLDELVQALTHKKADLQEQLTVLLAEKAKWNNDLLRFTAEKQQVAAARKKELALLSQAVSKAYNHKL